MNLSGSNARILHTMQETMIVSNWSPAQHAGRVENRSWVQLSLGPRLGKSLIWSGSVSEDFEGFVTVITWATEAKGCVIQAKRKRFVETDCQKSWRCNTAQALLVGDRTQECTHVLKWAHNWNNRHQEYGELKLACQWQVKNASPANWSVRDFTSWADH